MAALLDVDRIHVLTARNVVYMDTWVSEFHEDFVVVDMLYLLEWGGSLLEYSAELLQQ